MISAQSVSFQDSIGTTVASFLALDCSSERGGFLLGRLPTASDPVTRIDVVIPCPDAPSTASSLTFRADEWQLVHGHPLIRDGFTEIVGWFHSHPDFSVRMSAWDRFIQRHFFAHPGHVAWIRDPVSGEEAFWAMQVNNVGASETIVPLPRSASKGVLRA